MHELLLFASIPASKQSLLLSILAGISSMQPQPIFERRLMFHPVRAPATPAPPEVRKRGTELGVPQAFINGTYAVQIAADCSKRAARTRSGGAESEGELSDFEKFVWHCEFKDFPDVQKNRPATSRSVEFVRVPEGKKKWVLGFMEGLGYRFLSEFIYSGDRFSHGNIDLRLQRVSTLPQSPSPIETAPEDVDDLRLLDLSGAYMLQASILVAEDKDQKLMDDAFVELDRLKDQLHGIADLKLGDRLVMNPRLRPAQA